MWQETLERALAAIERDPYPDGWDKVPYTKLGADQIDGCIVHDYPPFQFVYQFDGPEEITVLLICLCFPHNIAM
jgi:hypothetical protein